MDLLEVKEMDLTSLDQMLTREETRQQHEARKRIIEEKIMRLELYIGALETSNTKWIEHIEKATQSKKRKEEETYAKMVDDEKCILNLINEGKDTVITLIMCKNDSELILKRLKQGEIKEEANQRTFTPTINLPQTPLPVFSGNPKLWRGFWSSFEAAVHLQNIPDIQKLNYLVGCLKGEAILAIRSYDITLENYEVIKRILIEKFG
ncbi:zinc knuckle family protein [Wuchereria bancrofti]|uniref:Zinc knuckle family protein n=1 Tax=Wuchereria bancrofti TaxID=6293 RepID=J9DR79_WUCBA|nr:zinc knuckle family protein [Wuchereria bancrofti]